MSNYNTANYNTVLYGGGFQAGVSSGDSIVFNDFGLQNSSIVSRYAKHEAAPERQFIEFNVPRSDGMNLQDVFNRRKMIQIKGNLKKDTNAELLDAMDEMKKFMRGINKILKITEGSLIRRYVATLQNPQNLFIRRDHYHITWVPFEMTFKCLTPFGLSENRKIYTNLSITSSPFTKELVHDGSADGARLQTIIQFNAADTVSKVSWENTTNDDKIEITRTFNAGDILIIDGETGLVTVNSVEVNRDGFPPTLNVDSNSFILTITSTSHDVTMTNKFFNTFL